jgi:ABC-2 type transport system permease protein
MRKMELRLSFITNITNSLGALVLNLIFFRIVFGRVHVIAGWSKYEVFLLLGVYFLFMAIINMFVSEGLGAFTGIIWNGDLDGFLTKPVNSQFHISFREIDISKAFDIMLGLAVIFISLSRMGVSPGAWQWIMACLHFFLGLVIYYSIWYTSLTIVIWTTTLGAVRSLIPSLFFFGQYPADIYKGRLKWLFMTVFPLIIIANFPAKVLLGRLSPLLLGYNAVLAFLFLSISILFWKFALRYYSSASS